MLYGNANARPACCRKNDDGNSSGSEVLLVLEIGVGGNKYLESVRFRRAQQVAILQRGPTKLISGGDTMTCERMPQRNRGSLVKQDTHLCSQQRGSGRVFQDVTRLRHGYAGKPLDELMNRGILFQVLEKCGNGNPRTAENPSTAYAVRVALDIGAGRPIDHG